MNNAVTERSGILYVVGTPIGNLGDLSPRAREILGEADIIAAEDTRRTGGLLSRIGVQARVIAYHEHNETQATAELLGELESGRSIALVSDAGTPLISDPGWRLVAAAAAAGCEIRSVPGPSALLAGLCVSGLPTDRFVFEGFLPRRQGQRRKRLQSLAAEARTLVFFEAVHRLPEALAALIEAFGAERRAAISRELTKLHEQTVRGTLADLATEIGVGVPLLGEFVIAVAGVDDERPADQQEVERVYRLLAADLPPARATALTAAITGASRNTIYALTRR
jgi:16S rRNA (cytidine1402-2'-O)-methyltransferase